MFMSILEIVNLTLAQNIHLKGLFTFFFIFQLDAYKLFDLWVYNRDTKMGELSL